MSTISALLWAEQLRAWWGAKVESILKMVRITLFIQRSNRVSLRYCPYYISIFGYFALSDEVVQNTQVNQKEGDVPDWYLGEHDSVWK